MVCSSIRSKCFSVWGKRYLLKIKSAIKTKVFIVIIVVIVVVVIVDITELGAIVCIHINWNVMGGAFRLLLFSFAISRALFSIRHTIFDQHLCGRTFGARFNTVQ